MCTKFCGPVFNREYCKISLPWKLVHIQYTSKLRLSVSQADVQSDFCGWHMLVITAPSLSPQHNHLTGMANAPPHGPPSHPPPHLPPPHHMQYPGRDLMPPHVPHPQGGGANYYNVNNNFDQQGFPPRPPGPNLGHQDEWGGGGGYYGDQYYHGRGAPGLRHGIRGGFRLRGRGYIKRGGGTSGTRLHSQLLTGPISRLWPIFILKENANLICQWT